MYEFCVENTHKSDDYSEVCGFLLVCVSQNLNIVRIDKSIQNIGRSLTKLFCTFLYKSLIPGQPSMVVSRYIEFKIKGGFTGKSAAENETCSYTF